MDAREVLRSPSPDRELVRDNGSSVAQWCPEDVLREVMSHLSRADVVRCSLVCRGWLDACRARLYSHVTFDTPTTSASLLSRTLCTCPHLLGLTRRISISPHRRHDEETYKWIPIAASFSHIHHFNILSQSHAVGPLRSILSSTPPFLSIKHVSLGNRTMARNGLSLQRVLELFPNADSFKLHLYPRMGDFSPPACGRRVIRYISITTFDVPANIHAIVRFLETYAPSLTRLDIYAPIPPPDIDVTVPPREDILARALLSMTHLESLTLNVASQSPFLDHVVQQLPHLRKLHCVPGTYSSILLQELPGQIHSLRLGALRKGEYDVVAIEEMIWRSRARKTSLRSLLIEVTLLAQPEVQRIREACAASGIHFGALYFHPLKP